MQVDIYQEEDDDELAENTQHQLIFPYLIKATETMHPMAHFHLAECYRKGLGVDQDHTKAVELYRSLADRGIPQAQIALGRCFESGEGVDQDFDSAIEWYSKAADQGYDDIRIAFLRGWFSFIGHRAEQSDDDALNYWHEVSTQSTDPVIKPIATHMVGWMHYLGRGTPLDKQKGTKIIRDNKSDEFLFGEDETLAAFVFSQSDSIESRKFFGLCQLGSDRDWLCSHLMAVCLIHGFGTTRDQNKAVGIFEQLANEEHSDSEFWQANCHQFGWGVSKDKQKAFEWFSKSAGQGNSYGQFMVGDCYFDVRYGHTKDHTKAAEWFRKSAEQGNRSAQNYLAICYLYGHGVPQDIDTAVFWFRKSADQGWQGAIDKLTQLEVWL